MNLIKLELLNLASLDRPEGEVIDFVNGVLGESSIFSIVGPTGSGKSTLLDAICLALYNRAPRYPKVANARKQRIEQYGTPTEDEKNRLAPTDCRNILTRGHKRGYSKLTFRANDGTVYRAEWHIEFRTKKYSAATTVLYILKTTSEGITETPVDWSRIPDILGLDYDQFLRTVLLAQGKFANFLTADTEERYRLLEKIVGNGDRFTEIVDEIEQRKHTADDHLKALEARTSGFKADILADDVLETLDAEIAALTLERQRIHDDKERVRKSLDWFQIQTQLKINVIDAAKKLTEARYHEHQSKPGFMRLALYDRCHAAIELARTLITARNTLQNTQKDEASVKAEIESKTHLLNQQRKHAERLAREAETARLASEAAKPKIARAREIAASIATLKSAILPALQDWSATHVLPASIIRNIETKKSTLQLKQASVATMQAELDDAINTDSQRLAALQNDLDTRTAEYSNAYASLTAIDADAVRREKDDATQALNALETIIADTTALDQVKKQIAEATDTINRLNAEIGDNSAKVNALHLKKLEEEIMTLTRTLTLMTTADWELHRAELADGQPCPLCGATSHPYHKTDNLQRAESELSLLIKDKQTQYETQRALAESLKANIDRASGRISALQSSLTALNSSAAATLQKINEIIGVYPHYNCPAENLIQLKTEAQRRVEKASEAVAALDRLTGETSKLRDRRDAALTAYQIEKDRADKTHQAVEKQITKATTEIEVIKTEIPALEANLEKTRAHLSALTSQISDAASNRRSRRIELRSLLGNEDVDAIETRLATTEKTATEALDAANAILMEITTQLSKSNGSLSSIQKLIADTETQISATETALSKAIAECDTDPEYPVTLQTVMELATADTRWNEIRERLDAIKTAVITATTQRATAFSALAAHQKHRPRQSEQTLYEEQTRLNAYSDEPLIRKRTLRERHDHAVANLGSLRRELADAEKICARWKLVWDSVGGKDGDQLRKIAQCYTLGFLIDHANHEISRFTHRYRLVQVRNSLGIRIIDLDRGGDIRDTTSLSGGETFIVSLGLALGLSALSSRNISIGNLFIDEGFGSLDSETLASVIESLTQLQTSQGKKVGVISHTEMMAEKIGTRIEVCKLGNSGSSRLEIYNKD